MSTVEALAYIALIWYIAVLTCCAVGYFQLQRWYTHPPPPSISATLPLSKVPEITIIRPCKGLEPSLYECLASTFRQRYPSTRLHISLCISTRSDPALPILRQLQADFPAFDTRIYIEEEDPVLYPQHDGQEPRYFGPNPKIRNMSRAYREARGDVVWILDSNVWVAPGVVGRMVDTLCGFGGAGKRKYKFVHQLPVAVDTGESVGGMERVPLVDGDGGVRSGHPAVRSDGMDSGKERPGGLWARVWEMGGGRLEEMFTSSSHAKFYTTINTVLIAPCIVGKSNMFRRSHLDFLTSQERHPEKEGVRPGIDYFADNICEDHLIGDLLWKNKVPEELAGENLGKHSMVWGDLALQPIARMTVKEYVARRIRWLRVRKWTVTLATLVEHGTESIACSCYGAFAITTLPFFKDVLGISPTWATFWIFLVTNIVIWAVVDRILYIRLHSGSSIEQSPDTPTFARPPKRKGRRPFVEWLGAWIGRETLAFPIWFTAVFLGGTVTWRGKKFWVGSDMKVHEIQDESMNGKARID